MERRAFLRTLGGLFVAAAAPTKTYAFFGNILRPKLETPNTAMTGLVVPADFEWKEIKFMIATREGWKNVKDMTEADYRDIMPVSVWSADLADLEVRGS